MQSFLRVASEADASEIAALVNRAYRPASSERGWTHEANLVSGERTSVEQVLSLFGPQSAILVLQEKAEILGCVYVQAAGVHAYIGMLATHPGRQAQGLGKQLLSHAEQYASEHYGVSGFKMSVLSSRAELIAFYERRGYVRTGETEEYPLSAGVGTPLVEGLQILVLCKDLADPASRQTTCSDC